MQSLCSPISLILWFIYSEIHQIYLFVLSNCLILNFLSPIYLRFICCLLINFSLISVSFGEFYLILGHCHNHLFLNWFSNSCSYQVECSFGLSIDSGWESQLKDDFGQVQHSFYYDNFEIKIQGSHFIPGFHCRKKEQFYFYNFRTLTASLILNQDTTDKWISLLLF